MARVEMDCNLKKLSQLFHAYRHAKIAKTQIMVDSLFENSLDIFFLLFCKHFVYDKGTLFLFGAVFTHIRQHHHDIAHLSCT